jgi:eukaryotic-like serine/threonine-protein kinase
VPGAARLWYDDRVTVAAFALRPGDVFHQRYTIVRCIASGGMGAVYEAVHLATRRRCALKAMLPSLVADADLRARFQTEATIAAQIGSDHIVDVLDAGIDPATGTPFLVMELLVGEELCDRIMLRGAMPPAEAVELLRQAALALERTHAAGIIHRDLKPENFFLSVRDDGATRIKILDFGIAKVVAESAVGSKQTGTMGTPLYMPPEQVDGTGLITFQADLYAFAQVTYAMLTGEPYFEEDLRRAGGVYGLLTRVMSGPAEPASQRARRRRNVILPPSFDAWFAKATAKRPQDRFQRAMEQVAALADALGVPLPARPTVPSAPEGQPFGAAQAARSGPYPAMSAPLVTGVPVSTDAPTRRRPATVPRWVLGVAAGAITLLSAAIAWIVLDVGGPRAASGDPSSAASGAAASPELPRAAASAEPTAPRGTASSSTRPATKPPRRGSVLDRGP